MNENYQDFLTLGGSLQGGEEKVEEVSLGLLGFRRDVEGLKVRVEGRKTETEALVAERKSIRENIQIGRTMLEIDQRLSELEESLMLISANLGDSEKGQDAVGSDSGEESDEEQGVSLSRLQRHAQHFVYTTKLTAKIGTEHPFVSKQQDRMLKIKHTVLLDLGTALRHANKTSLENGQRILKILEIYRVMDEFGEATKVLKESNRRP